MNDIKQFLRSNALRPTKQRIVIAGYLFDGTDKHVTAESLSTELAKRKHIISCLLYTSPSPRDRTRSRMPSSA